jgi:hypothetical protein
MSEKPRIATGSEVKGDGTEAVAGVRSAVEETLRPKITDFCKYLRDAGENGKLDASQIEHLQQLAEAIFDSTLSGTLRQDISLLLLKAMRLLSVENCDVKKINAILGAADILEDKEPIDFQFDRVESNLFLAGLDVVVEVPGLGALCGPDPDGKGDARFLFDDLTDPDD